MDIHHESLDRTSKHGPQNKIDNLNFTKFILPALRKNTIKIMKGQSPESDKLFSNTCLIKGLFPGAPGWLRV